jgi:hypothetical protein
VGDGGYCAADADASCGDGVGGSAYEEAAGWDGVSCLFFVGGESGYVLDMDQSWKATGGRPAQLEPHGQQAHWDLRAVVMYAFWGQQPSFWESRNQWMLLALSVGHIADGSEVCWARMNGSHGPPAFPPGEHWAAGMLSPEDGAIRPVPLGMIGAVVGIGAAAEEGTGMADNIPPGIMLGIDADVANGITDNIDDGTAAAGATYGLDAGAAGATYGLEAAAAGDGAAAGGL